MTNNLIDVDLHGLSQLIEDEGPHALVGELIRNSLDEDGVTQIKISLNMVPGRPLLEVHIEDDAPEGFKDLAHAYTLFASSYKKDDPEKAGRFNLGEKLFLAAALLTGEPVVISTTTGTISFNLKEGRTKGRMKREKGSIVHGFLKCNRKQYDEMMAYMRRIIFDPHPQVFVNQQEVGYRRPLKQFNATLPTVKADEDGVLRNAHRQTEISVYEVGPDEVATLYELGMPVVPTEDKYHISIGQKVPLNMQRDNVRPAYLRTVRTLVFNQMKDHCTADDASQTWVREATSDPRCSPEAVSKAMDLRFGEKRVIFDPSDPEANSEAASKGYTVVTGSMMNKEEWSNVKKAGAIMPAGQVFPTKGMYGDGPGTVEFIDPAQWTVSMGRMAEYVKFLGKILLGFEPVVRYIDPKCHVNRKAACWGERELHFNVQVLGYKWFEQGVTEKVDSLLIHEFGHHRCSNHHDDEYFKALTDLGAKLKRHAIFEPDQWKQWY